MYLCRWSMCQESQNYCLLKDMLHEICLCPLFFFFFTFITKTQRNNKQRSSFFVITRCQRLLYYLSVVLRNISANLRIFYMHIESPLIWRVKWLKSAQKRNRTTVISCEKFSVQYIICPNFIMKHFLVIKWCHRLSQFLTPSNCNRMSSVATVS